ncbi:MAG: HEAT repeat domain-containing protein [Gemmatimonadales bacterium]
MTPDVALEPLRNAVLALSGAVLLLSLVLLGERAAAAILNRRARRREALLTRMVYRAIQVVAGSGSEFSALGRLDRQLVRKILLRLAMDLRGDTGEAIAALYQRLGFLAPDLKRLRSWRATTRASAVADLGLIRAAAALPALLDRLQDPDVRVRQTAVWAVGQAGSAGNLASLIRLLGDPSRVVARRVEEVLAERGREVKDAIIAYAAKTASRAGRLAAIELIGWLRLAEGAELLFTLASDMDAEVRVKSVKAAAAIGDPRFVEVFHQRLDDPCWEVRCQAAKGLSVFGSPDSVPRLERALRDRQWWVRFYAAAALAEVGAQGEEALEKALHDPDSPVREMARYVLERGSAVPALP